MMKKFKPSDIELALRMASVFTTQRAAYTIQEVFSVLQKKGGKYDLMDASRIQANTKKKYPETPEEKEKTYNIRNIRESKRKKVRYLFAELVDDKGNAVMPAAKLDYIINYVIERGMTLEEVSFSNAVQALIKHNNSVIEELWREIQ
jgi:hypothetical protein